LDFTIGNIRNHSGTGKQALMGEQFDGITLLTIGKGSVCGVTDSKKSIQMVIYVMSGLTNEN